MFMIQLKNIDSDIPLERFIIQQYELEDKGIAEDEIKTILDSSKCLLVFDGYDEYKKGTNSAIDTAISSKKRHLFVLITSRPKHMDKKDREKLDGEIQIKGLSNENIEECIDRYFDKAEVSRQRATNDNPSPTSEGFKKKAKKRGIYGFLKIPILLLMSCVLYTETGTLPERRTEIIWEIIQMYIKRAKEKGVPIENLDELLCHLGKLSYKASQRDTHRLLIKKVCKTLQMDLFLFFSTLFYKSSACYFAYEKKSFLVIFRVLNALHLNPFFFIFMQFSVEIMPNNRLASLWG